MVYTSNADVFYKKKKNPYKGAATTGTGYGYGKLLSSMLGNYLGTKKAKGLKQSAKRKQGSLTKVLTSKTRNGIEMQEGANSLTRCNFGTGKCFIPRSVLDTTQKQVYVVNQAGNWQTTAGIQSFTEFGFLTPTIVTTNLMPTSFDKSIIHKVVGEVNMVNASSSNSTVIIYDVINTKDCASASNQTPGNAWLKGVDNEGGSATDYQVIGSEPTESILFNQFFKVSQRTRISLAPGEMHRHEVVYAPNKAIQGEYASYTTYGLKGLTFWTLIVHYGMPAHDSTTKTAVTIDISSLDIVVKTSYDYRQLNKSSPNWAKSNTLGTSFAVGEEFVNEAVGQVQNAAGLAPGTLHT